VRWERLTPVPLRHLEFLEMIYAPHAQSDTELYRHPGVEMVYVVEGRFVVYVGFDEYDLGPGDSLAFPSSRPHRYANPTDSVSRAVTVILHEPVGAQQLFSVESVARSMGENDPARGSRRPLSPEDRAE
jgi:mannose-6-phosphate isomerase-like protein (cupin superfamily)